MKQFKMKKYKFNVDYDLGKIRVRLNPKSRSTYVFGTGIRHLDSVLGGGLKYGLNLFAGQAGTGKSMLANYISRTMANNGKKVLYVCAEDLVDNPRRYNNKIDVLDYTSYLPFANKVITEILGACNELSPDLLVLDSLTSLFSGTKKSVEEADIRENVFKLAKEVSGVLPVIGITEMRGYGFYLRPAGGGAIYHSSILTLYFDKISVDNEYKAGEYKYGKYMWVMNVKKDRDGLAKTNNSFIVKYKYGMNRKVVSFKLKKIK